MDATTTLLSASRDLLDDRTLDGAALDVRGWRAFLLALDDATVDVIEGGGAWPADTPRSLRAFIDEAEAAVGALRCAPPVETALPPRGAQTAHVAQRKRAQVGAFARMIAPLAAGASRIVDVGSGHGHLTRSLAASLETQLPVVGVDREEALVERARVLARATAASTKSEITFALADVVRDGFPLSRGDVVVGLHACGELGDALVTSAARAGAQVALIGCCLQKRRAEVRAPLSRDGLEMPRDVLGLSNLALRDDGVEASRADNLAARERRLALRKLLEAAGVDVPRAGAEIAGLNRRAAHHDVALLVARAFALRGLAAPPAHAIDDAARWAKARHAEVRRLQLPRLLLARVLEVHVARDRARHLEAHGLAVQVGVAFAQSVSARNVVILARRPFT